MDTRIVRSKRLSLVCSWLRGLAAVLALSALAFAAYEMGRFERLLDWRYLQLTSAFILLYSVIWMFAGWVRVAEGQFRLAEYGGCGNHLRRIHFGDGKKWQLTRPLALPLEFRPPPHCVVILLVEENFFGWNRIRFRFFSLRYGRDVCPWSSGEEDDRFR